MSKERIRIKVRKKKKELDQFSKDFEIIEDVHKDLSHLIPLPLSQTQIPVDTKSWFNIQKIENNAKNLPNCQSDFIPSEDPALRNRFYFIQTSNEMKEIIRQNCHWTRFLYNQCVKEYLKGPVTREGLRTLLIYKKTNRFKGTKYEEMSNRVNSGIQDGVILDFFKGLNIQIQLVKEGKRKYFKMKYRKKKRDKNFLIDGREIRRISDREISCFPRSWPDSLYFKEKLPEINHACRIIWTRTNQYYLMVPEDIEIQQNQNTDICALDPGLRTFQTSYDNKGTSYQFGFYDYEKKIEPLTRIAERMRSGIKRVFVNSDGVEVKRNKTGLNKKKFRMVKNCKELKSLQRATLKVEQKISNLLMELRRKTVHFLCSRYKTIIIPNFKTQNMCQKIKSNGSRRNINDKNAKGLSRLGHFKFKQLLISKGEQTGTNIVVGHERYSSKLCTNCLNLHQNLGSSETYECKNCGLTFGRDIQAARNILLINWDQTGHSLVPKRKIRIR